MSDELLQDYTPDQFVVLKGDLVKTLEKDPLDRGFSGFRWTRFSNRWLKIFEASGALTVSGGGTPNYESSTIEVWPYDIILVEFTLGTSTDLDIGIRFRDMADGATLSGFNVRDYDAAAVLDLAAVFAETGLDASGGTIYHQYILDPLIPKHLIRAFVENDAAGATATYTVKVYGVRLFR